MTGERRPDLHAAHELERYLNAQRRRIADLLARVGRLNRRRLEPVGYTTTDDGGWGDG